MIKLSFNTLFCIALFIPFVVTPSMGQDSTLSKKSMLVDSIKKKGVYRSFTEFQQNNPSYTDTFFVSSRSWIGKFFLGQKGTVLKKINEEGKAKKIGGNVWGYSNGHDVFIKNLYFDKILVYGYFCVYEGIILQSSPGIPDENGMMSGGYTYEDKETFFLDYTTGNSLILRKAKLVTYVLSKDPELLAEFRKENKPKKLLLEYVIKFNERNTGKLLGGTYTVPDKK